MIKVLNHNLSNMLDLEDKLGVEYLNFGRKILNRFEIAAILRNHENSNETELTIEQVKRFNENVFKKVVGTSTDKRIVVYVIGLNVYMNTFKNKKWYFKTLLKEGK